MVESRCLVATARAESLARTIHHYGPCTTRPGLWRDAALRRLCEPPPELAPGAPIRLALYHDARAPGRGGPNVLVQPALPPAPVFFSVQKKWSSRPTFTVSAKPRSAATSRSTASCH